MNANMTQMQLVETDPQESNEALLRRRIDELEQLAVCLARQGDPELNEIAGQLSTQIRRKRRSLWMMRRDSPGMSGGCGNPDGDSSN